MMIYERSLVPSNYPNGKDINVQGDHPYTLASVLYDVVNRVSLTAEFAKATDYEFDLAVAHLAYICSQDLLIIDRNYPSYRMMAEPGYRNRKPKGSG